ncbi:MAG: hypothetical protein GEU28_06690 [Dehalococcoidia bacterium]|nr:hypothetical protein [Dehalococcoidia bacterium]
MAEGLYAARHRFSARATAAGYALAAGIATLYSSVTPATFTVESITVATHTVKERPLILYVVILSAIPSIILGVLGLYSELIDLLNPSVIAGVIAGVGLILTKVGVQYIGERPLVAGTSTLTGFIAYLVTTDLVVVIVSAMAVGTAISFVPSRLLPGPVGRGQGKEKEQENDNKSDGEQAEEPGMRLTPLQWGKVLAMPVLVGAFSLLALRLGAVVSYDTVNADVSGEDTQLDGVQLMTGAASLLSAMLGGAPVESTPAPMADTSMPVFSTVLFMAFMAVIAFTGLITRVGRLVPLQAIAGFLVVLGIPVIMPEQLPGAAEEPLPGGTALAVTALTNPFYGIIAGEVVALFVELGLDAGTGD